MWDKSDEIKKEADYKKKIEELTTGDIIMNELMFRESENVQEHGHCVV